MKDSSGNERTPGSVIGGALGIVTGAVVGGIAAAATAGALKPVGRTLVQRGYETGKAVGQKIETALKGK